MFMIFVNIHIDHTYLFTLIQLGGGGGAFLFLLRHTSVCISPPSQVSNKPHDFVPVQSVAVLVVVGCHELVTVAVAITAHIE